MLESTTRSPAPRRSWQWISPSRHGKRAGGAFHCLLRLGTRKDQRDCRPHDANPERPGPHIQRWILVPGCRRRIEQLGVGEALLVRLEPISRRSFRHALTVASDGSPTVEMPPSQERPHEHRYHGLAYQIRGSRYSLWTPQPGFLPRFASAI